ncbi:DUF177 domain-containing protein [Calditrichota bacterium]
MKVYIQRLSEGIHEITEVVSPTELSLPDNLKFPEKLQISVYIDKFEDSFRFKISITTEIIQQCDRCLNEFRSSFDNTIEQIYQLGSGVFDEDEDFEILPVAKKEIDISKAIYDVFLINLPIKKVCNESCRGLCPVCGKNLNKQKCNCIKENIDPRMEKLKSFLS